MTFGAGDWDAVGRLTLRRVRALYAAWGRTPPVAVMVAGYLGYRGVEGTPASRVKDKGDYSAFMAEFMAAGGRTN